MGDTSSTDPGRVFDIFSNTSNNVITSATSRITQTYALMSANSSLFIGLFAVVVITIIIAALLYSYLGWTLFSKVENSIDGTKVPILGTQLNKFIANVNNTANGTRRSFSFWIYINDMNKYSGQFKNVVSLTNDGAELSTNKASPHIFLDESNNSLYVRFTNRYEKNIDRKCPDLSTNEKLKNYLQQGIEVKYIPLQRWVHVAIVCNTDSFKTTLYAYVDGDLVNTIYDKETFKLSKNSSVTAAANLSDIDLNMTGYLYVGSNPADNCGPGFSGLISNFSTFNYELNNKDIYAIYNKGPINGLLAALGLGAYGVRSPIYKL
jgi:hypothetical protein